MARIRALTILNAFFFLVAFLVSNLSQFNVFGNKTISDISKKYDTLFAPADITFSIWGIIYLSLFGFCIYHLIQAFKAQPSDEASWEISQIDILFIVNNIASAGWVLAWTQDHLFLSVVLMLIQLLTLISINMQTDIYDRYKSLSSKIFTQFPLSIYFAWICIAAMANVSALLVKIGWHGRGVSPDDWAMILIGAATLISMLIIFARKNIFFGLVVIWALYGIVLRRTDDQFKNVAIAAWVGIVLLAIAEIVQLVRNSKADKFS